MEALSLATPYSRHFSIKKSKGQSIVCSSSSSSTSSTQSLSLRSRNAFTGEVFGLLNLQSVNPLRKPSRGGLVIRAEMFGQLSDGFESAWKKLKGQDVLTKENIAEPMRDIRRALLEADVSLPVVRRFVEAVTKEAVGVGVSPGVNPEQQLVKIVHSELVKLMGGEVSELTFAKSGPTVILLAGLQGVGKTTVSGKLALYLEKQGKKCMLIAGDVYRPAAIDQLVILGKRVGVPVYAPGTEIKPAEIARQGLLEAKKKNIDVVIMDTAGRLQINKSMMDELKEVKQALNPTEVLLVVDAMTGQEAAALVATFNQEIGITGSIMTKLDGDSRGGAALSIKEVSGKPIKLVGRGERMEDLEPFYPDRMAGRILGMGDVLSFVEKAEKIVDKEEAEEMKNKIMAEKYDFNDYLKQFRSMAKMGPIANIIGMVPGLSKVSPAQIREAEKNILLAESMIEAMTPEEREKPEILAASPLKRRRVARASGKTEKQVSQLVARLFQMRGQMKQLIQKGGSAKALGNLEKSMKAKIPPQASSQKKKSNYDPKKDFFKIKAKEMLDARLGPARGFGRKKK